MGRVSTLIELGSILLDCQALSNTVRCWSTFLHFLIVTCSFVMLKFCCASKIARASLRVENCARITARQKLRAHAARQKLRAHHCASKIARAYCASKIARACCASKIARASLRVENCARMLRVKKCARMLRVKNCARMLRVKNCARMSYFPDLNLEYRIYLHKNVFLMFPYCVHSPC